MESLSSLSFRAVWSRCIAAKTCEESASNGPQGLKPPVRGDINGTAKAVPFHQDRSDSAFHNCLHSQEKSDELRDQEKSNEGSRRRGRAALQGRVNGQARSGALAPAGRVLHLLVLLAAVFLFLGAGDADARFKDLGHRMMCTCGCGQVLLECNHVGCQSSDKMRNQLLAALDKGNNDDLILQGFVQEYGPTVIAAPTATGFNKVAWIMPFLVLALGIGLAVHIVRSWRDRPTPALADGIMIPPGNELDRLRAQARKETDL